MNAIPSTRPPDSYQGDTMIFLVGCPRSGTTWLQRLLSCHPQVKTGQESHLFQSCLAPALRQWQEFEDLRMGRNAGMGCYFTEQEFLSRLRAFMLSLIEPMVGPLQPGELFLEKSPSHALYLPEINKLLPRSRFIHLIRDPRDVAASLMSAAQSWGARWAPRKARKAGRLWTQYVTSACEAARTLPAEQYCELRYEELLRDTGGQLRRCSEFLGLKWDEADMRRAIEANQADQARASGGGTSIPLYGESAKKSGAVVKEPEGFVRKAQSGGWVKELSLYERYQIWRQARKTMAVVGYPWKHFLLR